MTVNAWDSGGEAIQALAAPLDISMSTAQDSSDEWVREKKYPVCYYWSEDNGGEWKSDGIVLRDVTFSAAEEQLVITCATYHLSAFGSTDEFSSSSWNTIDIFNDHYLLVEYGADSWPALLFLCSVLALFLFPAIYFYSKDNTTAALRAFTDASRTTYLAHGRCRRGDQPWKQRVRAEAHRARAVLEENRKNLDDIDRHFHSVTIQPRRENIGKVVAESVMLNHAWRHLSRSPADHFGETLLTRPQHLMILLADWMSAATLQSVFYGKRQFDIVQKARLAAATALFMLPTAFVFPALLRMVNTPPTSVTLTKRRRFLQLRSQEHSKANDLSDSDEEEKSQDDPDPAAEFGHMLELGEFSHCGDVPTLPTEIHTAFMRTI
ncbi:unnamed protein product, partial [Sphacelaria rigidula]